MGEQGKPQSPLGCLCYQTQGGDAKQAVSNINTEALGHGHLGTRRLMSFLCLKIPPGDGGWAPTSQFHNWAYQVLFDFTAPKDSQSSLVPDNSTLTYLFFFFDPPRDFPCFFWCLLGSDPSQPFRLSPCVLSCSLFTSLTYTDIPAHAHAHITVCMTGEGVLWHPTSSGAPWPFFGGSTVHAHISSTQHPDAPVSLPLLPGQDLTRLTIEIQHVTQGFRLMSWNHIVGSSPQSVKRSPRVEQDSWVGNHGGGVSLFFHTKEYRGNVSRICE